ncbi:helix-turn-helix domain-containing protein [Roseospira visakhapatnamensis]|uniref:Transcriptional regulator with XRE-family HTH domain n=1 Tax=Roseospira visakhapatnamensis TaxID=390880 RepID=A0A7W6RHA2_9PROT|nr:helix-turn-helix transcriptional regulator [Roseospira visakhapatnamensis]MBB4267853.1 transcriptional regulator with XRE-family HTH domain [Roseospira visakhapatnamensis]
MTTTADKIKSLRRDHGLTQEDLAERSGVGIATIQRAESGKPLSAASLASIAAAFGLAAHTLTAEDAVSSEPYLPLVAVTSGRALVALLLDCQRIYFDFCELDNLEDARAIEAFHDFAYALITVETPLAPIARVTRELEARDQLNALDALGFRVGGAPFDITAYEVDDEFGNGPSIVYGQWEKQCVALAVGRSDDDIARAHVLRRLGKYETVQGTAVLYPPLPKSDADWSGMFGAEKQEPGDG